MMSISVHQDLKLLFVGDDHGNSSLTPDLLVRFEVEAFKFEKSSIKLYFGLEYADLNSAAFQRYLIGLGYTTKISFLEKFLFGIYINHGLILRGKTSFIGKKIMDQSTFMGLGLSIETTYPITKKLRLSLLCQAIDRDDLTSRFESDFNTKVSVFLGVKLAL